MNAIATKQKLTTLEWNLADLFNSFPEKKFKKGDEIIVKNRSPKGIIFIVTGRVLSFTTDEFEGRDMVNDYFLDNSLLNLYSLSTAIPKNQSAVALSDTKVKIIPLLSFQKLLNDSFSLRQLVFQMLLKTANQKQTNLHRMICMSSNQRILHFLLDYVEDAGERVGYEWLIRNPLTHTQIGKISQTARQTTTTLLGTLKRMGIIHFNRKYLIVRDLEELKKLAHNREKIN